MGRPVDCPVAVVAQGLSPPFARRLSSARFVDVDEVPPAIVPPIGRASSPSRRPRGTSPRPRRLPRGVAGRGAGPSLDPRSPRAGPRRAPSPPRRAPRSPLPLPAARPHAAPVPPSRNRRRGHAISRPSSASRPGSPPCRCSRSRRRRPAGCNKPSIAKAPGSAAECWSACSPPSSRASSIRRSGKTRRSTWRRWSSPRAPRRSPSRRAAATCCPI